ncbi:MAG TPA: formyltetrahydrofolate deformylase [Acidisarcina sp.]
MSKTAILLISCPDRKGLVAAIANFLLAHDANILHADQHQDNELGLFFMRVEFDLTGFRLDEAQFRAVFDPIAQQNSMAWQLEYGDRKPPVAIFVSHYLHCLADLLLRHASGELACDLRLVISNHQEARPLAEFYGIPFHLMPVSPDTRAAAERVQLDLLAAQSIELIVLARYMQVLSPDFVARYPRRIINVHHSFLPAFTGARPYHAAFARGVKLIGSTSHYVTEVLDDGPIIEQDVTRISHSDQIPNLVQKGRDLERVVLSRAVRWHLEHRILSYANKTVIF